MTAHLAALLLLLSVNLGLPAPVTVHVTYYLDHGLNRWGGLYGCPARAEAGGGVSTDPGVIPPGSLVLIPGVGLRRTCDTGGGVRGNMVDIWVASRTDGQRIARQGSRRGVLVWKGRREIIGYP